jgi:hypothetical protein
MAWYWRSTSCTWPKLWYARGGVAYEARSASHIGGGMSTGSGIEDAGPVSVDLLIRRVWRSHIPNGMGDISTVYRLIYTDYLY